MVMRCARSARSHHRSFVMSLSVTIGTVVLAAVTLIGVSLAMAHVKKPVEEPLVTVVGDSITAMSTNQIAAALSPDYRASVAGWIGTYISSWVLLIPEIVAALPRHDWIIELGTNDARVGSDLAWASDLARELHPLRHQRCIILTTVNPRIGSLAVAINKALEAEVSTKPNFHLLDWGNAEWKNPTWLQRDGIHPTPAGSTELASLYVAALNACPR